VKKVKTRDFRILLLLLFVLLLHTTGLASEELLARFLKKVDILQTSSNQLLTFSFIVLTGAVSLFVYYLERRNYHWGFWFLVICLVSNFTSIIFALLITSSLYDITKLGFTLSKHIILDVRWQFSFLLIALTTLVIAFFKRPR